MLLSVPFFVPPIEEAEKLGAANFAPACPLGVTLCPSVPHAQRIRSDMGRKT